LFIIGLSIRCKKIEIELTADQRTLDPGSRRGAGLLELRVGVSLCGPP